MAEFNTEPSIPDDSSTPGPVTETIEQSDHSPGIDELQAVSLMYQSNQSPQHPPPGIPRAFDVFSCPGGTEFEFDELSLSGAGHLITTHGE